MVETCAGRHRPVSAARDPAAAAVPGVVPPPPARRHRDPQSSLPIAEGSRAERRVAGGKLGCERPVEPPPGADYQHDREYEQRLRNREREGDEGAVNEDEHRVRNDGTYRRQPGERKTPSQGMVGRLPRREAGRNRRSHDTLAERLLESPLRVHPRADHGEDRQERPDDDREEHENDDCRLARVIHQ
jgi:hypothetical protein